MNAATFQRIAREAPFCDAGHGFDSFGLHPPALAKIVSLAGPLYERYFRVESDGISAIPARGPAILVANHAGVLPIDAAMLCLDVLRRTDPPRIPRPIADRFVDRLVLLRRHAPFARARIRALTTLAHASDEIAWPAGAVIVRRGELATASYVIASGSVRSIATAVLR